ncbi:aminoacyl-tRNA hydrolase [Parapedobacter sp. ISTM3]|uniref:Peptidyl-tRNA hydrolase n=1 Tax=Parapedobacter luteus TaxID=623280 RepID=A0A1T5CDN5_9SPHI|nr:MULTISPECIES: aminoacyl-tRNA hydrolase [Parapedobacter]MBK1439052.1 aminoacyl-tRNA hydrolase [Parapedobacter sp. ISTM3]SKB57230.1 peptidyl-tRNA hydrolase, PTH1 family [Parapedobacter luteus]
MAKKTLIVGLGNIGPEYADTRHNIGFMVADELAKQAGTTFSTLRHAYYTEYRQRGNSVYVIKPTTYMNLSGKAVNYWMHELKIPLEDILVIVDDLALPFGKIRLRPKGSSAGHNGLKNIEALCGGQGYPRLRFGIGDNFPKGRQVDYVLSGFDDDELLELPTLIERAVQMVNSVVHVGVELTMTQFNK